MMYCTLSEVNAVFRVDCACLAGVRWPIGTLGARLTSPTPLQVLKRCEIDECEKFALISHETEEIEAAKPPRSMPFATPLLPEQLTCNRPANPRAALRSSRELSSLHLPQVTSYAEIPRPYRVLYETCVGLSGRNRMDHKPMWDSSSSKFPNS
jgi:hypothetical protein